MSLSSIYQGLKNKLNDNEGFFRGGKFTPVTQLTGKPLITPQPLYSPLQQPQSPEMSYSPTPAPRAEPTYLEMPKPKVKSEGASNLMAKLDQIKRNGINSVLNTAKSAVNNVYDDKGMFQQGRFTPLKPVTDIVDKPLERIVSPFKIAANNAVDQSFRKLGTTVGDSIDTLLNAKRNDKDVQFNIDLNNKDYQRMKILRASGDEEGANLMLQNIKKRNDIISKRSDLNMADTQSRATQGYKDLASSGIKSAELAATMTAGAAPLAINTLLGSGINAAIARGTGQDTTEAITKGAEQSLFNTGFMSLVTNPISSNILKSVVIQNPVLNQLAQRTFGGLTNLGEDELLGLLDGTNPDELTSFITGAVMSGNEQIAKAGKDMMRRVYSSLPKDQARDAFGKFMKVVNENVSKAKFDMTPKQDVKVSMNGIETPELNFKTEPIMTKFESNVDVPKLAVENVKPEPTAIGDILANIKRSTSGYEVKGKPIDFDSMVKEGWQPSQIDYAVKLANESRSSLDNPGAYVRGILKDQYPKTAAKMGKPLPPEPSPAELAQMDAKVTGEPKPITEVLQPRTSDQLMNSPEKLAADKFRNEQLDFMASRNAGDPRYNRERLQQLSDKGLSPQNINDLLKKIELNSKVDEIPAVKPITEPLPQEITAPKQVETPKIDQKSNFEKQTSLRYAEEQAGNIRRQKISDLLKKENLSGDVKTVEGILSGDIKASKELKNAVEAEGKILGGESVALGLPAEKLKENYVPHTDKTKASVETTTPDGYGELLAGHTFDPTKKRTGTLADEKMLGAVEGFQQTHRSILKKKFYVVEQASKIMDQYGLGKEKADQVMEYVAKNVEDADKLTKEHIDTTDFGVKHDYLKDAAEQQKRLDAITGQTTVRPVVKVEHENWMVNAIDNFQSKIRGDATFFKDKTGSNKEIYNAFLDFRNSQNSTSRIPYKESLGRFISTIEKYDYEDPAVRERVNEFIDSKLKENKVMENMANKVIRGATEVLSMAQIGGNAKTVITQPTETFRIIPEFGLKKFAHGVTTAFNPKETSRLVKEYGLEKEVSGNLAQNPLYKSVQDDPTLAKKSYESVKNVLFKGLQITENWKNVAFAAAAEQKGIEKGYDGEKLKKYVMDKLLTTAHMADTDMTPNIMKNNPKMSALLQYSQYLLKNEVLKWDTAVAKDKTAIDKLKKLTALFAADIAAIGATSAVTGVAVDGVKGWLSNSGLPNGFGPLLTVPYQMATDAIDYAKLSPEEREKQDSLLSIESKNVFRNFIPAGNQIVKTSDVYNPVTGNGILQKGYSESKKGNVNYTIGSSNMLQKAQAVVFGKGALEGKKESDKKWDDITSGKGKVYPTLTTAQSETLKKLPKDQQQAYYDSKMASQVSAKDKIEQVKNSKKSNFISDLLGGKKTTAKVVIPTSTSTNTEKTQFKSYVKEALDSGNTDILKPEELKAYFYEKVDAMPESSASEKQNKTIENYKTIDSINSSTTLDQATKDKLITMSGISKEDLSYYDQAKDDATVKAMRQEEKLSTTSRDQWLSDLEDGRRLVGNKQITDNTTLDQLYERGALSDKERDYLKAVKFDPATGKYYLDRDYKGSGSGTTKAEIKKARTDLKTLKGKLDNEPKNTTKASISDYLMKKPSKNSSKTIASMLSGGKFKTKATPKQTIASTLKVVKRKYY